MVTGLFSELRLELRNKLETEDARHLRLKAGNPPESRNRRKP